MQAVDSTLALILGGGRGSRLFPLTLHRSKPAVPIGGKYRPVDVPISNCLHSGLRRIFVLTQYNSQSLNAHIAQTYTFDIFSPGFVTILAAEQTEDSPDWYQGTSDAVRKCWHHLRGLDFREVLILSGDQLYRMDYRRLIEEHRAERADVTVAVKPVTAEETRAFGILQVNGQGRIVHFEEKPGPERLSDLESTVGGKTSWLASMGIYVFSREALREALTDTEPVDFGRHVIPQCVPKMRVRAFVHDAYWEDVGTIRSYFEANLGLTEPVPPFDFYEAMRPVYTHPRFLPATKVEQCTLKSALISEGCFLLGAEIERTVIGIRSRIGKGVRLRNSLVLGADRYETLDEIDRAAGRGTPPLGIGEGSQIENAIVDKNARIGRDVKVLNEAGASEADGDGWYIRDGVAVIPKNAVIPDGTVI